MAPEHSKAAGFLRSKLFCPIPQAVDQSEAMSEAEVYK